MKFVSKSKKETQKFATKLAPQILRRSTRKKALVIGFEGELGAGKTTFIQGLAKGLGIRDRVKSPTFVLMRQHHIKNKNGFNNFFHLDCYRLNSGKDLGPMNFKEILNDSGNIVVVEWPERVKSALPKNFPKIHLDHLSEDERKISVIGLF